MMPSNYRSARFAPALMALCLGAVSPVMAEDTTSFELKPEARLHLDHGAYDSDVEPLADGWIVRRATLGLEGKIHDEWSFEVGYGMADDGKLRPANGEFRDVSLTYKGWGVGDVTVGQFKVPFGLAESTSSNKITFMERALPLDTFAPSRRMGVGFSRERDDWTFRAMAFGASISGGDRGHGLGTRLTWAPVHENGTVVHLGVAAVIEKPRGKVDFDTAPEARVADVDLTNTGRIEHVSRIDRLGLEGAWRHGPLSIQGEWMQADVQRDVGLASARLDGWYVGASWVLTGESRRYKHGEFKGIEPAGPAGAWELTLRYSRIDLDDGDVLGGKERNATVGLNYYLNDHLRIMFNYIQVRSERRGQADDPCMALLRVQMVL